MRPHICAATEVAACLLGPMKHGRAEAKQACGHSQSAESLVESLFQQAQLLLASPQSAVEETIKVVSLAFGGFGAAGDCAEYGRKKNIRRLVAQQPYERCLSPNAGPSHDVMPVHVT